MSTRIKILKPFTERSSETGVLTTHKAGDIETVSDEAAAAYKLSGFAEDYALITPTGTVTITENGTADVSQYASANVAVPEPTGSITITENGTVDVSQYAEVVVNVSASE